MSNLSRVFRKPLNISLFNRDEFFTPFQDHFNKFFDEFWDNDVLDGVKSGVGYPKFDASVEDGKFVVRAAVPGVEEKDLNIELSPDQKVVTISGTMSSSLKKENAKYYVKELHKSQFSRQFAVPEGTEGDPEAEMKDGILTLSWKYKAPEVEEKSSKKIEIRKK